jgi:sterol desaturase/sphingolipid hydroxylase (fatty acid hydroxylase superfamily)
VTQTEQLGQRVLALAVDVFDHVRGLLLDPRERTFFVALLVAALIVAVLAWRRGSSGLRGAQFWNPSARVDYGLILAKPLVVAFVALPTVLTTLGVAMATIRFGRTQEAWLGPMGGLSGTLPTAAVTVLYTLALFVAWDFSRFALHWLMHRSSLLWQFHQVHHSATSLTPFTLYRVHPVESILYRVRGIVVTGVLTGVFSYAFGPRTVELQLWGVNALGFLFSVVSGNLRHSHVRWSFGARVERWLISPAQHQLHHGRAPQDSASNLGTWLAVWDRLAGSLRPAPTAVPEFGLEPQHSNHRSDSVLSALFDPVLACVGVLAARLGLRRSSDADTTTSSTRAQGGMPGSHAFDRRVSAIASHDLS